MDVEPIDGAILPGEVIATIDRGLPIEYVVLAVLPQRRPTVVTLICLNWILPDNEMVGKTLESRPMKSAEKKRYLRLIAKHNCT
jgi:hypothetical protein